MKDSMINVGVVGLGGISKTHIPAYQSDPRVRLAAICDIDTAWLEKEKTRLGAEYAYADYRELFNNKDIDAVSICLPNYLHKDAVIAALEAGKHVLCEKPMALNAQEATAMHEAAQKNGKKLMISQNQRFGADAQLLKRQVEAGLFGEIYFIRVGWRRPLGTLPGPYYKRDDGTFYNKNWFNEKDKGGGVLRDLGSHMIDLAMYLTGFPELEDASCSCYRKFFPEVPEHEVCVCDSEDLAAGHIKFKNGLSLQLEVSFGSFVEGHLYFTEIYGTKAGASRRSGNSNVRFFKELDGTLSIENVQKINIEARGPMMRFIDCIYDNTEPPVTSAQGVQVIKVLDALYASAGRIR